MSPTAAVRCTDPQPAAATTGARNRPRPLPRWSHILPVRPLLVITSPCPSPFQSPTERSSLLLGSVVPVATAGCPRCLTRTTRPLAVRRGCTTYICLLLRFRTTRSGPLVPDRLPDRCRLEKDCWYDDARVRIVGSFA